MQTTKDELPKKWKNFLIVLSMNLRNELVSIAPVDTGRLRSSIKVVPQGNNVIMISMPDYALYVEFGTAPHIIRPKNAKALHWQTGGKDVFAKIVHHPGTQPQPFIRNTLRHKLGQIIGQSLQVAFA
jgi:HK97 gp10 family phage protein